MTPAERIEKLNEASVTADLGQVSAEARAEQESLVALGDDSYLVFEIGSDRLATPLLEAREVLEYIEPRQIAGASPWLMGLIDVRGTIITTVDFGVLIGRQRQAKFEGYYILVDGPRRPLSLRVDALCGAEKFTGEQIKKVTLQDVPFAKHVKGAVTGAVKKNGQMVDQLTLIVSLASVVNALEAPQSEQKPSRQGSTEAA